MRVKIFSGHETPTGPRPHTTIVLTSDNKISSSEKIKEEKKKQLFSPQRAVRIHQVSSVYQILYFR